MTLFHVLLVMAALFGITLWRPIVAVAILIIGVPAYQWRVDVMGFSMTALEAGILGTLAGYTVFNLQAMLKGQPVLHQHWSNFQRVVPRSILWFIGVTILGWIIASVVSIDTTASLGALKSWLIEPLLIGLILISELPRRDQRVLLDRALLVGLLWVAVAGLLQLGFFQETLEDGRLSSVFAPVANYYAMFAAPLIVLALGRFIQQQDRWLAGSAFLLGIVALVLSQSYGGLLAVTVGIAIVLFKVVSSGRRRRLLTWFGVLVVIFGLSQLWSPYLHEKINFSTRSSSLVRTEIWRTAAEIGQQHPVFGIGPGTFELAYREVAPVILGHAPLEWLVAKPHNLYLNLWVETGLLGLIGVVGLFVVTLRRGFSRPESAVMAAGLVAILVHGLVDTPLFKNDLALLGVIMIVLSLIAASDQHSTE